MTDTPPSGSPPQAGAADSADPSMEEILASIRRILNEDETAAPAEADAAAGGDDVLVLDQSMLVPAAEDLAAEDLMEAETADEPAIAAKAAEHDTIEFDPPALASPPAKLPERAKSPEPATVARPAPAEPMELPTPELDILGPEAAAAAASSISSLVRTLSAGRATQVYSGGPTLEDMVRAELRPLLKEWLDAYLPPIVERLVRTEIERVVGRAVP